MPSRLDAPLRCLETQVQDASGANGQGLASVLAHAWRSPLEASSIRTWAESNRRGEVHDYSGDTPRPSSGIPSMSLQGWYRTACSTIKQPS
jgi:hypothetical protein